LVVTRAQGGGGREAEQPPSDAIERVVARVRELAASYKPPDFAEVPTPDAALFLSAIDHSTGFEEAHEVDGEGPFEGSALLWALGLRAEKKAPGALTAPSLRGVSPAAIGAVFRVGQDSLSDPEGRAKLWDDLARGLIERYETEAAKLIEATGGKLGGENGALRHLGGFAAFKDPLQKKSFLVCKIWERRGWLEVTDPENWQICADNVLMRLALRSGLVEQGDVEQVRAHTRDAFKLVATEAELPPPLLDDLLWERGREDPNLLGAEAGELDEPDRASGVHYY
jgi:hypothetical protein